MSRQVLERPEKCLVVHLECWEDTYTVGTTTTHILQKNVQEAFALMRSANAEMRKNLSSFLAGLYLISHIPQ